MFYDEKWLKEKFEDANQVFNKRTEELGDHSRREIDQIEAQKEKINNQHWLTSQSNQINRLEYKQDALFDCLLDVTRQMQILKDQNNKLVEIIKTLTQPQPQITPIPGRGRKAGT